MSEQTCPSEPLATACSSMTVSPLAFAASTAPMIGKPAPTVALRRSDPCKLSPWSARNWAYGQVNGSLLQSTTCAPAARAASSSSVVTWPTAQSTTMTRQGRPQPGLPDPARSASLLRAERSAAYQRLSPLCASPTLASSRLEARVGWGSGTTKPLESASA